MRKPAPSQSSDLQEALDDAYLSHHYNCPQCIAAGRGAQYGLRCDVGAPLWMAYIGASAPTSTTTTQEGS